MSIKSRSKRRLLPGLDQLSTERAKRRSRAKRRLVRDALRRNEQRDIAFRRMILSIPPGKVSSYGAVAAARESAVDLPRLESMREPFHVYSFPAKLHPSN
jgi:hypothetical protein